MINHNIESEKNLINLLGYSIIESDNINQVLIIDENQNKVGYIKYKRVNKKKNLPDVYGYQMFIDSDKFFYKSTRNLNNRNQRLFYDTSFLYEFKLKKENGILEDIVIDMGINPSLILWSKEHGFMDFKIENNQMYLNFKSNLENFLIEETIIVKLLESEKIYEYCLSYSSKNDDSKDKKMINISFKTLKNNQLEIVEKKFNKILKEKTSIVDGTIKEAIINHEIGIDSFSYFRYLINKEIPFKEEIIFKLLESSGLKDTEFSLFIPDLNENQKVFKK